MKQIDTDIFLKYIRCNIDIYDKNIFYIKLLIDFEDLEFYQYINLSQDKKGWITNILACMGAAKCSDSFIDKFINQIYLQLPLRQRLQQINLICNRFMYFNDYPQHIIIKLITKLSFYEKERFFKYYSDARLSPTQLIINKFIDSAYLKNHTVQNNILEWAVDLFNSKYLDSLVLVNILKKFMTRPEKTFGSRNKVNHIINLSIGTQELSESYEYNIGLLGYLLSIYDDWLKIPFGKLLDHLITKHFISKEHIFETIMSNFCLMDKFITTICSTNGDFVMDQIMKLFGPTIGKYVKPFDKINITNSFIKYSSKKYIEGYAFQRLIKIFKLEPIHIQTIFTYINNEENFDLVHMLRKKHFVHMKNYLIDLNGYVDPELRIYFFVKFTKYKLLTPNEIKHYILENIQYFSYWQIKKCVKTFELEYINALKENISMSENCIYILSTIYKYINCETIDNTFKLLFEKNKTSYSYYDIIIRSMEKYPIEHFQNMFISNLQNYSTQQIQKPNWVLFDIFELCFIQNTYNKPSQVLHNYILTNKSNFSKQTFSKYSNLYKVD